MAVSEPQRIALHRAARQALGEEEADTLMALSPPANTDIATRQDIDVLRTEMKGEFAAVRVEMKGEIAAVRVEMKGEIAAVRAEMNGGFEALRSETKGEIAAVRGEIATLRAEMKGEFKAVRAETAAAIERATNRSLRWMVGVMVVLHGATVGLITLTLG